MSSELQQGIPGLPLSGCYRIGSPDRVLDGLAKDFQGL